MTMQPVQATPYIPGRAIGRLGFGPRGGPGVIAVLGWAQIDILQGAPEALIVVDAAPLSHAMIRLFARARPVVCMNQAQAAGLVEGATVLLDGYSGIVRTAVPGDEGEALSTFEQDEPSHTADGTAVELRASVSNAEGAALARQRRAAAIGLVRAEYLGPGDGRLPEVKFYESALAALCRAADPLAVTVRLGDYGPSKRPAWLEAGDLTGPLGLQGVRWFDHDLVGAVIAAQVQAVARLAPRWELRLLLPFITLPEECRRWRDWVEQRLPVPVPLGAMAETPAAVLALPELLETMDFVAIGCNDLLQGLFEADRDLPAVRDLLDPYAPAVFRLLRVGAEAAGERCRRIQMCGLLPQLPGLLPILIGLGYRAFAVEPLLLPWLAQQVRRSELETAQALAAGVCAAPDGASVRRLLGVGLGASWSPGAAARF